MTYKHVPVMQEEVLFYLNCRPGKIFIDGTLGGSGHAASICSRIIPHGLLIGTDQDIDSINNAKRVLSPFKSHIRLFNDNFSNLHLILSELGISGVDGILLDLGISFNQLMLSGRGFSFNEDSPLDMRMDTRSKIRAADLVNDLDEKSLANIFRKFGEEKRSKQIAWKIVNERKNGAIKTSKELSDIIRSALPSKVLRTGKTHPATRVFMALRIAVNKELERLESFMANVESLLNPGGRLCVISFHSLEDRLVKQGIKGLEKGCTCPPDFPMCTCNKKKLARALTKKVVRPTEKEIALNPLARSAKLRVMERL